MARKILFVTADQQRYDALGCNGGKLARTPVIDGLARAGINYAPAHCQNVVCMPSRSTMLTGTGAGAHRRARLDGRDRHPLHQRPRRAE